MNSVYTIIKKTNLCLALLLAVFLTTLAPTQANARMAYYHRTYLINFAFDKVYQERNVVSVMAHYGIQRGTAWTHVKDIYLQLQGDRFIAQTDAMSDSDSASGEEYLLVTFEVRMEGSSNSYWTPVMGVPSNFIGGYYEGCYENYSDCYGPKAQAAIRSAKDNFHNSPITQTETIYYYTYH
ncbi:MAG: hypothetical protein ACXVCP_04645 [Bdellovibrio sp.]